MGAPDLPERLGRYQVEAMLGVGAVGRVFRALDPALGRPVAIKVLAPHLADAPQARQEFLREARAAAGLRDDHVVTVHTVEEEGGLAYLVMEYVPGGTLADRLRAPRGLRGAEILSVGRQVARGLAAAHARGLVHRDIKPSNVLLRPEGDWHRALIADFGLALQPGDAPAGHACRAGTPGYMAPEQIAGGPVDHRCDLYALGVLLYHMVAGRPPFLGLDANDVMLQHFFRDPPPPSEVAPGLELGELEGLIMQLLQKAPQDRPQSAGEVLRRLEQVGGERLLSAEERARLAALRRYRVLDTGPEPALDDLAALASYVCGTPIALVSLVDEDRQWLKARVGVDVQQTARNVSFCTHTIRQPRALVVPDATRDRRFAGNPYVLSDPNIRFYAGVPVRTPEGHALGSLCAIDRVPRELSAEQLEALERIGRLVQAHLEARRALMELREGAAPVGPEAAPTLVPAERPAS